MDPLVEEEAQPTQTAMVNPVTFMLQFLASYGWWMVGAAALALWLRARLQPRLAAWRQAREDAEYHKDPDKALARLEAVQRAREKQQQLLLQASERALEQQREREERKRAEAVERLRKYGAGGSGAGRRLGEQADDYMPLSAGESTSSYRPPKRSKCGGGGCGK